jgi:succinoglycan biosynthesis transport protein ExoP
VNWLTAGLNRENGGKSVGMLSVDHKARDRRLIANPRWLVDSSRLLNALRRWWFVVLACLIVGFIAGSAYLRITPEEYTAQADVLVAVGGENAVDLSSGSSYALQQARNLSVIADRPRVVDPVVRRLNLPDTASQLRDSISATVPANTSIVTLEVTYPSAERATAIVNALADSLAQNATDLLPPVKKTATVVSLRPIYQGAAPQNPSSPSTAAAYALGLGGGLLVGLAMILLLDLIRPRRSASQTVRPEWAQPVPSGQPAQSVHP